MGRNNHSNFSTGRRGCRWIGIIAINKTDMRTFNLLYEFHGTQRHLKFDNLFEFSNALCDLMDNPHVAGSSITFYITTP